jgi:hypothetical protein
MLGARRCRKIQRTEENMARTGIAAVVVCLLLAVGGTSQEPTTRDVAAEINRLYKVTESPLEPITRDKLLGKWTAPRNIPMSLEFTEKKVLVTFYDVNHIGGVQQSQTLEWDYAIDPKGAFVKLGTLPTGEAMASANLRQNGTLLVSMGAHPPMLWKWLSSEPFEPVRPRK